MHIVIVINFDRMHLEFRKMHCSMPLILQLCHSQSETPQNILALDSLINTAMTCSVINDDQGVALLIRPLCLKQPGCGFLARCRLAHFTYHSRNFQFFVG